MELLGEGKQAALAPWQGIKAEARSKGRRPSLAGESQLGMPTASSTCFRHFLHSLQPP